MSRDRDGGRVQSSSAAAAPGAAASASVPAPARQQGPPPPREPVRQSGAEGGDRVFGGRESGPGPRR